MKVTALYGRTEEKPQPTVLAPMAGITDFPYRYLCRSFGADVLFTEMVSSQGIIRDNPNTWGMLRGIAESDEDVVVQLFGGDPAVMGAAAVRVVECVPVRAIDVNMGCPVPKVTRTGAGAALMCDAGLAFRVVSAVRDALEREGHRTAVSAKIRAGWDEERINALEVAQEVVRAGAETVAVHARTRQMLYSGGANWEWIREVKDGVGATVVGNGDVSCAEDARRMFASTGCDAVMVGRAAVGNPWIFRHMQGSGGDPVGDCVPTAGKRLAMALFHTELEVRFRGERRALPFMRQQLHRYVRGMPRAAAVRDGINRCETLEHLRSLLEDYAAEIGCEVEESEVTHLAESLPEMLRFSPKVSSGLPGEENLTL